MDFIPFLALASRSKLLIDFWLLLYLHASRFEPSQQSGQSWPLGIAQGPLPDLMSVWAKLPAQASKLCTKVGQISHCCVLMLATGLKLVWWIAVFRKLKVRLKIFWWIKTLFLLLRRCQPGNPYECLEQKEQCLGVAFFLAMEDAVSLQIFNDCPVCQCYM